MRLSPLLALLLAVPLPAESILVDHTSVAKADALPKEALDRARKLDVLFGHQSVGGNILEGLSELAEAKPDRYALERTENPEADWFRENDGLGDFAVGENEDPMRKIEDFRTRVSETYGDVVSVAMFKLCFVDLPEEGADPKEVFEAARTAIEGLEKEHPKVVFVWWTCPLATDGNSARLEYARLVRTYCREKGKALFDLADIECDGKGDALKQEWTDDGGHLNEAGRARAARAFWVLLARLAGAG